MILGQTWKEKQRAYFTKGTHCPMELAPCYGNTVASDATFNESGPGGRLF